MRLPHHVRGLGQSRLKIFITTSDGKLRLYTYDTFYRYDAMASIIQDMQSKQSPFIVCIWMSSFIFYLF